MGLVIVVVAILTVAAGFLTYQAIDRGRIGWTLLFGAFTVFMGGLAIAMTAAYLNGRRNS